MGHAGGAILSRSPELFLERRGHTLSSQPMKGTAARHTPPAALAASEKDRAENIMIVDLIRNDMGRTAPPEACGSRTSSASIPIPRCGR
ncbi:MAG: chorismate-binding protein [Pseudomonadales bacterium]|nr:chorismate-binding protein [Pseudomonadales bacterium]